MKILHVCTSDTGGAAQAAIRLHKELLRQGVDSSFLFAGRSTSSVPNSTYVRYNSSESRIHKTLRRWNLHQSVEQQNHRLISKISDNQPFECFSFSTSSIDVTRTKAYQQADIVHLHWVGSLLDYSSFFHQCNKPVVWTLHDMNPFLGGFHYEEDIARNKNNEKLMNMNQAVLQQRVKALEDFSQLTIVTPSQWLGRVSKNSTLFRKYAHHHIYNGLDTQIFKIHNQNFARSVFNIPVDVKMMLFVSDHLDNHRKGMDMLLEAFDSTSTEKMIVCAIGKQNTLLSKKNVSFVFLDNIKDERLMSLAYASADFVVIPSREDNLPNVMIEALSCGTPVISFPVGGLNEIVEPKFNGVLAEEVSSKALAKAITKALEGDVPFDRATIAHAAHQKFNVRKQAALYLQLYEKTI